MKTRFLVLILVAALIVFGTPVAMIIGTGELAPSEDKVLSVAVLINEDSADDPYTRLAIQGVYSAIHENSNIKADLYESFGTVEDKEYIIAKLKDGYDLVFEVGENPVLNPDSVSLLYPDTQFIFIDSNYEYQDKWENVSLIDFRSNESSFIAGYIAGMMTNTQKVGFVAGNDGASINKMRYGFEAGVKYAEVDRGVPLTVYVSIINSFDNQKLAYEKTMELFDKDVDIVMMAAGYAGIGGIYAATVVDKFAIGVDVDQSYVAPDYVLCSVTKNLDSLIKGILKNAAYLKKKNQVILVGDSIPIGEISIGLDENAVDVVGLHNYVKSFERVIPFFKNCISAGLIPVPDSKETMNTWSVSVIRDNEAILIKSEDIMEAIYDSGSSEN